MMKRLSRIAVLLLFGAIAACAPREQVLVILSTNDMHAHIERFPRLATAVERCRDTASVLLVDAGDRWTASDWWIESEETRVEGVYNEEGEEIPELTEWMKKMLN